jgi:uncharacterized protein (TIGR03067 family)
VHQELASRLANLPEYQYETARSHLILSSSYLLGSPQKAEAPARRAVAILEPLTRNHPGVPRYREALAEAYRLVGIFYVQTGRFSEAEPLFRKDLETYEQLARTYPKVADYRGWVAVGCNNLGFVYLNTGRGDRAVKLFQRGIALCEPLARDHPQPFKDFKPALASCYISLANAYVQAGRPAQAEPVVHKGLDTCEQLLQEYPKSLQYVGIYFQGYVLLAFHLLDEKPREKLDLGNRAIPVMERVLKEQPQVAQIKSTLAVMLAIRASALTKLARCPEALRDWDRALALSGADFRTRLLRLGRAITLAHQGHHRSAVNEAKQILAAGKTSVDEEYQSACVYAVASASAAKDNSLGAAERARLAEQYAVRGVELLRHIQATGRLEDLTKVESLKKDRDLASLRSRADFRKVRAGFEELRRFQGVWTIVSGEFGGKPDPTASNLKITFRGNTFSVRRNTEVLLTGTFRVDPTEQPNSIDVTLGMGRDKGKTRQGIYTLDGDTLKNCYCDFGKARPREFTTRTGTGLMLFVYGRDRP